jgi:hypothetical protein
MLERERLPERVEGPGTAVIGRTNTTDSIDERGGFRSEQLEQHRSVLPLRFPMLGGERVRNAGDRQPLAL